MKSVRTIYLGVHRWGQKRPEVILADRGELSAYSEIWAVYDRERERC